MCKFSLVENALGSETVLRVAQGIDLKGVYLDNSPTVIFKALCRIDNFTLRLLQADSNVSTRKYVTRKKRLVGFVQISL